MAAHQYLDFDLQISTGPTGYRARVLNSPAGQAASEFRLPFSDDELTTFVGQLLQSNNRQSMLFEKGMVRTVGGQLFDALFQGELLVCLGRSLDEAQRQGASLRIRLRLSDAPQLVNLPWEYLFYGGANRFLTLSTASPLVHFLELPAPVQPLTVTPPVGILVLIASPSDLPALDVEKEWSQLQSTLGQLTAGGQVQLIRLDHPSLAALQAALRQHAIHVIHFVGHGSFDAANQESFLAFCTAQGTAELVSAQQIGKLLHNERTLRLVVLNSCEGSRTALADPFAGAAQTIVQQGVPAVIAMQFVISDAAAITFAGEFYAAIADGYPVDTAVTEARVAISTRQRGSEWGTPKLFMRATDGILWRVPTKPAPDGVDDKAGAGKPLDLLTELLTSAAVRKRVAAFRADFEAARQQIALLVHYKELHDLLHRLQFRCYNVLLQEAPRFPADPLALDNLLNYEVTLQDIVSEMRSLSSRSGLPTGELAWVGEVTQAQAKLHDAVTQSDADALKRALWLLKRVLALQPSSVNGRLNATARALRLSMLVEAILSIHEALEELRLHPEKVVQFEAGLAALRSLDGRLTAAVEAHDRWQAVERMLSRIEDVMAYDVGELELSWPDVQASISALCQGIQEEWVTLLNEDGTQLSKALAGQNPTLIQRYFRRYRQRAGNRFYQVDISLKNLCEELRTVGEPLTSVLQILE
jgi:hypothetical protein